MKLLLEANLSWRLTVKLKSHFEDCLHVDQIGLNIPVSDKEIWGYALSNQLIIITNDDDFLNFANVKGFPPKVILLRTGNQSNKYVEELLVKHKTDIQLLSDSEDYGLLEIF